MAQYPYLVNLSVVVGANEQATLTHSLSNTEELTIVGIRQQSTGAFSITNIRNSDGMAYTNANFNNPIEGGFISDAANQFNGLQEFPIPLVVGKGMTLFFDLLDTSGSGNTIRIVLACIRNTG